MSIFNGLVIFQIFMVLICIGLVIVTLFRRASYLNKFLLCCAALALVENSGYLMELTADNLTQAIQAVRLEYLAVPYVMTAMLFFTIKYCRIKFPRWLLSIFLFIGVLVSVSVWAFPNIKFYYTDLQWITGNFMPYLKVSRGILYYIFIASNVIQMICCLVLPLWAAHRETVAIRRRNCYFLEVGAAVGTLPYMLEMTGLIPIFDVVPASIAIAAGVFIVGTLANHMLDVAETAEANVLYELDDPIIALNQSKNFIYANEAAKKLFPSLNNLTEGEPLIDFPLAPYFKIRDKNESMPQYEIGERAYFVDFSEILEYKSNLRRKPFLVGYQVTLTDVSAERASQAQARAQEIQKLSRQSMLAFKEAIETFCSDNDENTKKMYAVLDELENLVKEV